MSVQSQDLSSVYSCCYQASSEVLAFIIGWTSLISQTALVAAICKVSAIFVNHWTENALQKLMENVLPLYIDSGLSVLFALVFTLFILTGLSETFVWYLVFIPVTFILMTTASALAYTTNSKVFSLSAYFQLEEVQNIPEILISSALCTLFFSGPQSILRIPQARVNHYSFAVLGPLNILDVAFTFSFLIAASKSGKYLALEVPPTHPVALVSNILFMISLCVLGIEAFYPLHFLTEDMSTDGLLFRNFSKKWKPFCFAIISPLVQAIIVIAVALITVFLPLINIICLAVVYPLLVNSVIPFLVLLQRYKDNTSWQYEPMFHTSAKTLSHDRSRKKSQESQYTNNPGYDVTDNLEMSTTCIDENNTESSSDTDVDSVVQQYKDQARIANMSTLDGPDLLRHVPEPTPTSSFRAKFVIAALFVIMLIASVTLNFVQTDDYFIIIIVVLLCILLSTGIQGILVCLPQNQRHRTTKGCCIQSPSMPWIPSIASFISNCLLVNCLKQVWSTYLGWFLLGMLLYFSYGIRSSTAANSFYNLKPAHIALRPLPSYRNNCVTQVIPSQRKRAKNKRKIKTGKL
ncbi:probable cationic amino acid transporter [Stegodyphus dumicola]|uniref:probable cationic amino acid transporter n=1 Tax=Stegodyphus dumicola TaxID=202533 RepID=UPI0015A9DE4D|nr:probable cationic amino acid transporter [Stegodyphus dumicola]